MKRETSRRKSGMPHGKWAAIVLLLSFALPSVVIGRSIEQLHRDAWTTRDGLPHNSVNDIAQTPEGYLWFATWEGLVRFNGHEFKLFDRRNLPLLRDSSLRALHVDAQGRLVIGGARGTLARQDGRGGWEALPAAPAMVTQIDGDENGMLWVGTSTFGVWQLAADGTSRTLESTVGDVGSNYDLAQDAQGRWWAAHGSGLQRAEGTTLRLAATRGLPAGPVNAVTVDGEHLLIGTADGVFLSANSNEPLDFRPLDPTLAGITVTRLLPDGDDGLWIGTVSEGLMHWTPRGLSRLGVGPGRPTSRIVSLFIDHQDNLWVGTNSGLFRFTNALFTNLTRQQGLPDDYVRSVLARADGSVLIGTVQGLAVYEANHRLHQIGAGTALANTSMLSLADAGDGRVWIGTQDAGVLLWDGQTMTAHIDVARGLPSNEVRALVADGHRLWIGTAQGLAHWDGVSLQRWTEAQGLPSNFVIALKMDSRQRLWVGTSLGASLLVNGRLQPLDLGAFEDAEFAFSFLSDPGRDHVWIASDRGLLRFDADGRPTGAVGLDAGLPFEKVFGLLLDPQDQLWASGNRGVLRLDLTRLNAIADGADLPLLVERFTEVDGMVSAQGNGASQPVATIDGTGRLWFATAMGATRVDPADLQHYTRNAPPVIIESVLADGRSLSFAGSSPLVLPADTRRIELRYAGLGFVLPERLRYRHRLVGFDTDWIERGTETRTEFTALPPGRYIFQVEAAHPRGDWGQSRSELVIELPRQWWQHPLLPWGIALTVLGLLVAVLRWRLYRLALNERRLARLVEERTREIQQQKEQLRFQAEEFARQAREDPLTGIANRRAFDEVLTRELSRAQRAGTTLGIILLDLDHFKDINDRWNHTIGDEVLKRVASHLKDNSRDFDLVARWGGEEFAILLPGIAMDTVRATAERLRAGLAALDFSDIAAELRITASFGVADAADVEDHHGLLHRVDQVLYRAKASGRDRVEG